MHTGEAIEVRLRRWAQVLAVVIVVVGLLGTGAFFGAHLMAVTASTPRPRGSR